jgi:predicted ATPase/DNA-binding SARP family transcriptional activator
VPDKTNHPSRDVQLRDLSRDKTGSLVAFPRARPSDNNLPLELSSFIGREREISEVKRLLRDNRLLTLCGPGGCGKTRLALAVAQDLLEEFEVGVWWVGLASLSDPKLVPGAVASALGVREPTDRPLTEVLVEHLKPRKALLVLDNCEHLVETCADLADTLLRTCPNIDILATSREPLRISGESNLVVPSLSVPDPGRTPPAGELMGYEAVRLFVERARAVDAGSALTEQNATAVARLCRKLDGIPLAIELAAARTRVLSVEQISEKLEDPLGLLTTGSRTAAPRHQTLRATLQWSYGLLKETERALFGRLSVFVGGFTLEAAEAVGAREPLEAGEVLDLLSQLVDKSLVVSEAEAGGALRYRMLEPVRQYALERLEQGGEAGETRGRHAAFFLALAEQASPELLRAEPQVKWLERWDKENGNLRSALSWALSVDEIATAARLCWVLWRFWWIRNQQPEGRRWMERVLLRRDALPPALLIRATIATAAMAYGQGDGEAFLRYVRELEELSREVGGDALAEAFAHVGFGLMATARGDLEAAAKHLEEALPFCHEAGEYGLEAQAHVWLGTVLLLQGDHQGARLRFEEGLALGESMGDRLSICNALYNLAQLALAEGDYEAAYRRFAEGIAPSEELGDRANTACILEGLGVAAGARGEALRAAWLLGASEALIEAIGGLRSHLYYRPDRVLYKEIRTRARTALGEAAFEAALEEGRATSPEQAIEYALEEPMAPDEEGEAQPPAVVPREDDQRPAAGTAALRIFALGPARVEKEGHPIDSPGWIQKSRELLYFLLCHPEGRTKEQIGLALWPEASTAQLRSSFHDTVYRLRRALGAKEWIAFQKGRYAFNRSLEYSLDVEAFEQHLAEAQRLKNKALEQAIGHLQEAAELYRGDFLEDLAYSEWAMVRQEELQRAYGDALLLLGRLLFVQERYVEAAEAYRKAISHDEFIEEAHRELMRCQAALGERGRAIKHYEELVELLYEQLGTAPAPETRALYERLRAGEEV